MKHNRTISSMLLSLMAMAVACTAEDTVTERQTVPPTEGAYTYTLHLDMPNPDDAATRAAGVWADGSQVEFFFYTEVSQTGYKGIPGTATYSAKDGSWTLKTNTQIPNNATTKDCEARYFKPGADPSNDFLTAVYHANSTYTLQGDTSVYAALTLKPCNWRLRFRGTKGTQLTLTATNIRHCTGDSLHAVNCAEITDAATIPLTVAADGYTSYIYSEFHSSTLTLTTGEEQYTRTLIPIDESISFTLDIPQKSDYASKGWTLIEDPHTTATTTPLTFAATPAAPQTIAVTSNEEWTVTVSPADATWCTVTQSATNGNGTVTVTATENPTTSPREATITIKGQTSGDETTISVTQAAAEAAEPEAIDLGLSVKWANMNVGATKPEGYGDLFAWGETKTKANYDWDTYTYCKEVHFSNVMTKYSPSVDSKTVLDASDDAAVANWGSKWRMPTTEEQQELLNECTWIWTTQNGVNGYRVTGTNGNSIFLPAAGYRNGTSLYSLGSYGYYWSSSLYTSDSYSARELYFHSGNHVWRNYYRYYGQSVRPVQGGTPIAVSLTVSPESLSFDATGRSKSVNVTCNSNWTTSSNQSWCTISPSSGTNNGTITVNVKDNTNTSSRSATITVTAGTETKQVTVTQTGKSQIDVTPFDDDENWD